MKHTIAPLSTVNFIALEQRVNKLATKLGIRPARWDEFMGLLGELKEHHPGMYSHSLRVGLYSHGIAEACGETDLVFPLFGGCGHDIGKCQVSNVLLDAKHLSDKGYERIKAHSMKGYDKLKDRFLFTAFIAGLHHRYRDGGYGIDLDHDSPMELPEPLKRKIKNVAVTVMVADFFDALTTRNNTKGLVENFGDRREQRQVMYKHFPEHGDWIDWLFAHQIKDHD